MRVEVVDELVRDVVAGRERVLRARLRTMPSVATRLIASPITGTKPSRAVNGSSASSGSGGVSMITTPRTSVGPLLGERGRDRAAHRVADDDRAPARRGGRAPPPPAAPALASSSRCAASPSRRGRAGRSGSRDGRAPARASIRSHQRIEQAKQCSSTIGGADARPVLAHLDVAVRAGRRSGRCRRGGLGLPVRHDGVHGQQHDQDDQHRRDDAGRGAPRGTYRIAGKRSPASSSSTPAAFAMKDTRW